MMKNEYYKKKVHFIKKFKILKTFYKNLKK